MGTSHPLPRRISSRIKERQSRDLVAPLAASRSGDEASKWSGKRYLREYWRWLHPYRFAILAVFVIAVVTAALDMIWPLAVKVIIDGLTDEGSIIWRNFSWLNRLCVGVVTLLI